MVQPKTTWIALFFPLFFILTTGCAGKSEPPFEDMQLKNIYEIYLQNIRTEQKPPAELSDLTKQPYIGVHPVTVRDLQEGKYIVVFGVTNMTADVVLAYEKDAPVQGGAVLMANGTVKKMSADEFKAAKR